MGCYIYWEPVLQTRTKPDRDTLKAVRFYRGEDSAKLPGGFPELPDFESPDAVAWDGDGLSHTLDEDGLIALDPPHGWGNNWWAENYFAELEWFLAMLKERGLIVDGFVHVSTENDDHSTYGVRDSTVEGEHHTRESAAATVEALEGMIVRDNLLAAVIAHADRDKLLAELAKREDGPWKPAIDGNPDEIVHHYGAVPDFYDLKDGEYFDDWGNVRVESDEPDRFINHYYCATCRFGWEDRSPHTQNMKCDGCGAETEPEYSEDIDEDA